MAVLPFISLSPDPRDAFFADGIPIEILTLLNKIQELTAIGRESVARFRDSTLLIVDRLSARVGTQK